MAISDDRPRDDTGGQPTDDERRSDVDESSERADTTPTDGGEDASATDPAERSGSKVDPATPAHEAEPSEEAGANDETATGDDRHWLRRYARAHVVHALVVLAFVLYPFLLGFLQGSPIANEVATFLPGLTFLIVMLYLGLFAASFDFISGYTGYLSFGHAAFFGTGAYFVVLVTNGKIPLVPESTPFMVTMLLGALLAMGVALLMGAVSFRLTGVYFAMITLGIAQVLYEFVSNWDYLATNPRQGPTVSGEGLEIGIPFVDQLNFAVGRLQGDELENVLGTGITIDPTLMSYFMLGIVVLVSYFAMQRIIHSPFGRVMIAIRENETRAEALGYPVFRYKMVAFAISAFFAAIAGALFAAYSRAISPETTYYFLVTADALIVTIIGGIATLAGPIYGTVFHGWLDDVLSSEAGGIAPYLRETVAEPILAFEVGGFSVMDIINNVIDGRAPLFLGIIFVLFVLFVPNGLLGTVRDWIGGPFAQRTPDWLDRYRGR